MPVTHSATSEAWNRFLQDLELARNYPLSIELPLGEVRNPILERLLPSYSFMRLVSLLDEALADFIEEKSLPFPTKVKQDLYNRVEFLSWEGYLTNAKALHDLRERRKSLAHQSDPEYVDWAYLNMALGTVEIALKHLGLVETRPVYEFFAERVEAPAPDDPKVAFAFNHRVGLKKDGKVVIGFGWTTNVHKE